MTWRTDHQESEALASEAAILLRSGRINEAHAKYHAAAEKEELALNQLNFSTPRTFGIISVSTSALWFKAREFQRSESVAYRAMSEPALPEFAKSSLRTLLQSIWTEAAKAKASVSFLPGQVFVSIKGGLVVSGGAPLDLVVDKVKSIQSMFYRTIEFLRGDPYREGKPTQELQNSCRPWLFQEAPASYQFSVAVQKPEQSDFFRQQILPEEVVERFFAIVEASVDEEPTRIVKAVPDERYRSTFLKHAQNLAPGGKTHSQVDIRIAGSSSPLSLTSSDRPNIRRSLQLLRPQNVALGEPVEIRGVLRALDLDHNWLAINEASKHEPTTVRGLRSDLDDAIGEMVNRPVVVQAIKTTTGKSKKPVETYRLVHIELDD